MGLIHTATVKLKYSTTIYEVLKSPDLYFLTLEHCSASAVEEGWYCSKRDVSRWPRLIRHLSFDESQTSVIGRIQLQEVSWEQ
jgi:hypothetical protein